MPEGAGFYLDDISIPVSWFPIDTGRDSKLYVELYDPINQFNPDRTNVTKMIEIEDGS